MEKLDSNQSIINETYYVYENWVARQKNKIHKGSCGHCNNGQGKRKMQDKGERGVWVGPFATQLLAERYVSQRNLTNDSCRCIL